MTSKRNHELTPDALTDDLVGSTDNRNSNERHKNSKATVMSIGLFGALFAAGCAAIAFGGFGGSEETADLADMLIFDGAEEPNPASSSPVSATGNENEAQQTSVQAVDPASAVDPEPVEPAVVPEPVEAMEEDAVEPPVEEVVEEVVGEEIVVEEVAVEDATDSVDEDPTFRAAVIGADSPPSPPGAPHEHAVSSGGKLYMRGTLPSVEVERKLVAAVERIMGVGNGISEYGIDSNVVLDEGSSSPVYVEETVLFESGSAEIAEAFYPVIAPLPILTMVQPDVVVTVTGHTDSLGDSASNLALSQARVNAVREWAIGQGADPDRVIAEGLGESEPIADNDTAAGRALNRRVEFLISGFSFD